MATHLVSTPVPGHTGSVGGVHFADGRAEVDDERHAAELAYFRAQGYSVEPLDKGGVADEKPPPPSRSASAAEWRSYAVSAGMPAEEARRLSRDQLIERLATPEEADK
jgi:hypothetical protein